VKLIFDDKSELSQLALYASGANVISGRPHIKAEAAVKTAPQG